MKETWVKRGLKVVGPFDLSVIFLAIYGWDKEGDLGCQRPKTSSRADRGVGNSALGRAPHVNDFHWWEELQLLYLKYPILGSLEAHLHVRIW
jgi:hypothetical protein